MKKFSVMLVGLMAAAGVAHADVMSDAAETVMLAELQMSVASELRSNNLINWKVGEYQDYNIESSFGNLGVMKKRVDSEVGNTFWLKQEMSGGMIGNNLAEIRMDRADGKILEYKLNGQPKEIPTDQIEVIDQEATTITVPAGTFDCIHVRARSQQARSIEVWANPRDITMDGGAQLYVDSGMIPMTLKLTGFGGR